MTIDLDLQISLALGHADREFPPPYSTDLETAFELLAELHERGFGFVVFRRGKGAKNYSGDRAAMIDDGAYRCAIQHEIDACLGVEAETPAMAIALSAAKALGVAK